MDDQVADVINKTEPDKTENQDNVQPKRRKGWVWALAIIAIIILIPVLVIGYLGFIPGVSALMGSNKPRDLGVEWTVADYESYQSRTGGKFLNYADAPDNPHQPGKKIIFAGGKEIDVALTQEEITATINSVGWTWMPISNAQVRFGEGTVEVSGNLKLNQIVNFVNFIGGVGYNQDSINNAISWASRLAGNPPIYVKAATKVTNNQLALDVQEVQVGRFTAPKAIASKVLNVGASNAINRTPEFDAKSVTFSSGNMNFSGTTPTLVYVKTD